MPNPLMRMIDRPAKPKPINPKIVAALRSVIHDGLSLQEAAEANGITTFKLRCAFDHTHVLAFVRAEKNVRLEAARLSNINALATIRDNGGAAGVSAVRALEEMAGERGNASSLATVATTPGVTIVIQSSAQSIEGQSVTPLTIDGESMPDSPESARSDDPQGKP